MNFEFCFQEQALCDVEIADVGNCCLEANTDLGEYYYFISKTVMGFTSIIQYGPILIGYDQLPPHVSYTYDNMEYNQGKITKIIDRFLNKNAEITQAQEVSIDQCKINIKNMIEYL